MNTTGWSLYKIEYDTASELSSGKFWKEKLVDFGLIKIEANQTMESLYKIRHRIKSLAGEFHGTVDAVIVETPEIIYTGNQSMKLLLSKAASTLETAMAAATMISAAYELGKQVAMIRPREWQMGHGRPKKVNSKVWSTTVANNILAQNGRTHRLHTKDDENIADAISMGSLLMKPIFTGQIFFH